MGMNVTNYVWDDTAGEWVKATGNTDPIAVENQFGYEEADRAGGADIVLGATGAAGDILYGVSVTEQVATSAINIYDGTVAGGTLFFSVPIGATIGTFYEFNCVSANGAWTVEDDANNAGIIIAIGRFT